MKWNPEPKLLIPCKSIINLCYLSERASLALSWCVIMGEVRMSMGLNSRRRYHWMSQIHKLVAANPQVQISA
ncbi:hypothetical protein EB796_006258 [Bugula neritina]|uniref:Uncharacterized protein n=1 Tax=Bugula neritina TaxID=10212 RepID=A0A7J7KCV0_BUGNE|nr:hypothetical protein EB796_006258 [Bugula neritina]